MNIKSSKSLKPIGNRVVLKRQKNEEMTLGGIILPESAQNKKETATVVAIGSGKVTDEGKTLPIPVSVGDVVLMDKYSGQEVTIDDEEFIIAKADDIVAIIEE